MTIVKVDAEKIKEARALSGLSQEEMAQRLGLSKSAVFNWESGRGSPYPKTLKKIAEVTGKPISLGWLFLWLLLAKNIFPISEKPVDNIADIGYIQLVGTNDKKTKRGQNDEEDNLRSRPDRQQLRRSAGHPRPNGNRG